MKGNKIFYAGIAILILGIGFAVGTYAYYQTTVSGNVSGTVLAWQCTANNVGEERSFTLSMGSLYPGSSGSLDITIASTISASYQINFVQFHNMGSGSNHPNLNLYTDSGHASTALINTSSHIQGTVAAGGSDVAHIYYYWPYGTTTEDYNSTAPWVDITVVCTQT